MVTAKPNRNKNRYWLGQYTSAGNKVKWIAKFDSIVEARKVAHKYVIASGYRRAFRVVDSKETRIDEYYTEGYRGNDIYYHGRFGCVVVELNTRDYEEVYIYTLKNGSPSKELRVIG